MGAMSLSEILNMMFLMLAMVGGGFFLISYREDRRRQARIEEEKLHLNMESLQEQRRVTQTTERLNRERIEEQKAGTNSGGYILVELPDEMRSIFTDLLKGFEEYARLRGYHVSFSVDTSIPNKIAFKFTLQDGGISVSTQTVRKDIHDYIQKVQKGDLFDDLPTIISEHEHIIVVTALKNRISFLAHNYNLEKNSKEVYERLLHKMSQHQGFVQPSPIIIQSGGVNHHRSLTATNSSNVLQGDQSGIDAFSSTDNSIKISNSFNKRKEQVNKIDEIVNLLKQEKQADKELIQELIRNFSNVKEEIAQEDSPDTIRLARWLSNAKQVAEKLVLTQESIQAINWICTSFGFVS